MQKTREITILEILGMKNDLTFAELRKIGKMGTESLVLGLEELMKKKLVKKDFKTKRYILQTETKNKMLLLLQKKNIIGLDPKHIEEELRDVDFPFEVGYALLRSSMFTLSKLTVAQNTPKLTVFEKSEFEKLIKHHNLIIQTTFDVLYDIDFNQTLALKKLLDTTITDPKVELKKSATANQRQKRRAEKTIKKINKHIHI